VTPAPDLDAVAFAFLGKIKPKLLPVISGYCTLVSVDVVEVLGGARIHNTLVPAPNAGTQFGDMMPVFVAWGFQAARQTRDVRGAYKRIGPMSESSLVYPLPAPDLVAPLSALATALGERIDVGGPTPVLLDPLSVSFEINGQARPAPLADVASSWRYVRVTTQNTRKV
jgi:hypothetical protein